MNLNMHLNKYEANLNFAYVISSIQNNDTSIFIRFSEKNV